MIAGGPAVFVRLKRAWLDTPVTAALTWYGPPAIEFAVNAGANAIPLALVTTTVLVLPLEKVPPAPLSGDVNVTLAPGTALPKASITKACNGISNEVWTAVVCVLPPATLIEAGGP